MRQKHLPRPTYANVIATVALFLALGGSAYAALGTSASESGVITACAHKESGSIRIVAVASDCAANDEMALSWYDQQQSDLQFLPKSRFGNDRERSTFLGGGGLAIPCYIGELKLVAFGYAPQGTAFADGQLLSVSQNPTLYSLIGNAYGGTPGQSFRLPDLHGLGPGHTNYIICMGGTYPSRL